MTQNKFNLDFESFQLLLLEMAQQRSVDELLKLVTSSLASTYNVALARVWMITPGDICNTCNEYAACQDKSRCLHLMASHGLSIDNKTTWNTIQHGAFRRFPMGVRKVGRIASSGQPGNISAISGNSDWIADRGWVKKEHIASFVGQPLIYKGEVLGVLAMFTRIALDQGALGLMRMIADHLAYAVSNARAFEEIKRLKRQIENENAYLRKEVNIAQSFNGIIGKSNALHEILQQILLVAPIDTSVLITGESGTGKELIAREIHSRSKRAGHPMIKINCAAIPKNLFESEFFGHARGAFTGAYKDREGFFQIADRGTLFLDEVGEIPLELQGKLLRVLQEGEYQRVGEEKVRKVDVRIISATNRDLGREVTAGRFREDLYYRVNVFPFLLPPLRDRKEDIPLLVNHFLALTSRRLNRPKPHLTQSEIESLTKYDWPGNIRELQNVMERAVITSHLGKLDSGISSIAHLTVSTTARGVQTTGQIDKGGILTDAELRQLERENMIEALRVCNGKIYGPRSASEKLGIKPTTLISRLKKMGITLEDWNGSN
ncbi:sigma-54-dependent Fis family transcriptional regulator [Desulfosporosinus meridiei]|uniref:Transcriptional regulator containing GAF, AAA-type ATPase, and DNA binding domains n=1 Tax=Desulfosporosinus meridiei (strain ATCC BAA-275 / DSM 13257 / KCTC 12902 / NCIMB 13706 / S10) TaxID=768704 RepID=J7IYY4_DESMD|nr:sigma 54-interacting transcriptional regulator [Desulfosporosinus meridiei]AFQ45324.1 transcriptional regulator containing GAF, AAA-type ATPase, and DNA binding domains [Desulfosporosinus meridiei DSM 13257]